MHVTNFAEVIALVDQLSPEEKLQLLEYVAHELRDTQLSRRRHWREFRGLGKEIWQGVDTQAYIDELRNEWER